ncbi:MAG: hypothetical protein L0Z50_21995 [Verrucomicrobiales bacterium]|nr:hypothetical protein [Verrucomicrobiales bacterium]
MSLRVLVIPEDPTNNGYILKPLVERMLTEVGKPNARVVVLTNPKLGGYAHADAVVAIKEELGNRYGHFDVWLFFPDADQGTDFTGLEAALEKKGIHLRCCAARPEVEAWVLAGHRQKLGIKWSDVAAHRRLKEEIFEPFLREHGDPKSAGGGRESLMRLTLANYRGLLKVCPELKVLEAKLREVLGT